MHTVYSPSIERHICPQLAITRAAHALHELKTNLYLIYLGSLQLFRSVQCAYWPQNLLKLIRNVENGQIYIAVVVLFLQITQNLSPGQTIATLLGATCCVRLATCCDVLGVVGSNLIMVKFEPTTPNMSQHIATRWPNAHSMLRPTLLRYVALACCDRLAGA